MFDQDQYQYQDWDQDQAATDGEVTGSVGGGKEVRARVWGTDFGIGKVSVSAEFAADGDAALLGSTKRERVVNSWPVGAGWKSTGERYG